MRAEAIMIIVFVVIVVLQVVMRDGPGLRARRARGEMMCVQCAEIPRHVAFRCAHRSGSG